MFIYVVYEAICARICVCCSFASKPSCSVSALQRNSSGRNAVLLFLLLIGPGCGHWAYWHGSLGRPSWRLCSHLQGCLRWKIILKTIWWDFLTWKMISGLRPTWTALDIDGTDDAEDDDSMTNSSCKLFRPYLCAWYACWDTTRACCDYLCWKHWHDLLLRACLLTWLKVGFSMRTALFVEHRACVLRNLCWVEVHRACVLNCTANGVRWWLVGKKMSQACVQWRGVSRASVRWHGGSECECGALVLWLPRQNECSSLWGLWPRWVARWAGGHRSSTRCGNLARLGGTCCHRYPGRLGLGRGVVACPLAGGELEARWRRRQSHVSQGRGYWGTLRSLHRYEHAICRCPNGLYEHRQRDATCHDSPALAVQVDEGVVRWPLEVYEHVLGKMLKGLQTLS